MLRFALSEKRYFIELAQEIRTLVGDSLTLPQASRNRLPLGGLDSVSILQKLMDSMNLRGSLSPLRGRELELHLQDEDLPSFGMESPDEARRVKWPIQATVMRALQAPLVLPDLNRLFDKKLQVTLTAEQFNGVSYRTSNFAWITDLIDILQQVQIHARVIWWKSVCGAWTTSHRMHEDVLAPCVFGCLDCKDTFCHYLECPIL